MRRLFTLWIGGCLYRFDPRGGSELGDLVRVAGGLNVSADEQVALATIARERQILLASGEIIAVQDFGAGYAPGLARASRGVRPRRRAIAEIVRRAAVPDVWGRFLFLLVRRIAPMRVLELGTSLGISGAYLVAAMRLNEADRPAARGRFVTLEGDPDLAHRAEDVLSRLGGGIARVVKGRFQDTLQGVVEQEGPFDFAFIDGHHEEAAVLRYFERIRPHMRTGGIVVFDDLEPWFATVHRAWRRLARDCGPQNAIHLGKMGLLRID